METMEKYAYFQLPSQVEKMDEVLPLTNCTSRADLVRTAIDFYIGYILQNRNVDYLSPMITSVIKNEIHHTEKGMCEMLFKIAVDSIVLLLHLTTIQALNGKNSNRFAAKKLLILTETFLLKKQMKLSTVTSDG